MFHVIVIKGDEQRRLDNRGRGYATRQAAHTAADRYERQHGFVRTETIDLDERVPSPNDAAGWQAYRLRDGISGSHH